MAEAVAEKKSQYEGMFVLDANLAGKHWEKARGQLKELLENSGVEIIRMEKWEERKLAYEIDKHRRGVYVLCFFKSPPDRIQKLRKNCRMAEWILRELILTHSGEVTDDLFRKPRVREKDREESRRKGRDSRPADPAGGKGEGKEAGKPTALAPSKGVESDLGKAPTPPPEKEGDIKSDPGPESKQSLGE